MTTHDPYNCPWCDENQCINCAGTGFREEVFAPLVGKLANGAAVLVDAVTRVCGSCAGSGQCPRTGEP